MNPTERTQVPAAPIAAEVLWRNRYRLARLQPETYTNVAEELLRAILPQPLPEGIDVVPVDDDGCDDCWKTPSRHCCLWNEAQ